MGGELCGCGVVEAGFGLRGVCKLGHLGVRGEGDRQGDMAAFRDVGGMSYMLFIFLTLYAGQGRLRRRLACGFAGSGRGPGQVGAMPAGTASRFGRFVPPPPIFSALPETHPAHDVFRCLFQLGSLRQYCLRVEPS